jgi:hypothetical protein
MFDAENQSRRRARTHEKIARTSTTSGPMGWLPSIGWTRWSVLSPLTTAFAS